MNKKNKQILIDCSTCKKVHKTKKNLYCSLRIKDKKLSDYAKVDFMAECAWYIKVE